MKYAIIKSGGKQYKVSEGEEVLVDRLNIAPDTKYDFPEVLMYRFENEIQIGTPYLKNVKVAAKVRGEVKGEKIRVSKFKAKVRYRRTTGFRPKYSKLMIESIGIGKIEEKEKQEKLKAKTKTK